MSDTNAVTDEVAVENDVSSQTSEINDTFERKFTALQSGISELNDLMLTVMEKSKRANQNSYEQCPSMQPVSGLDSFFFCLSSSMTFCERNLLIA